MRTARHALVLLLSCVIVLAACTNGGGDGGDGDASPASSRPPATTLTTVTAPATPEWVMHEAPDDCMCADGSDFVYFSRVDDPERVVLYFQGGGACFDATTCAFEGGTYKVRTGPDDDPTGRPGIFDFDDDRNPFQGWSMVFVPYCTGDVHLGDTTREYAPGLTVEHNGFVNATAGYEHLLDSFPDATEVLVTGSSAGGVPSPLFGALVADALPDAEVAVLADASGGYASNPTTNAGISALWGTAAALPDWPELAGVDPASVGIPDLFHVAGNHAPRVRMARYDNAFDSVQRAFAARAAIDGGTLLDVIDANERLIEERGVEVSSYVAPGELHTILGRPALYELTVEGVPFVDWLTTLLDGGEPGDVHCTDCGPPG